MTTGKTIALTRQMFVGKVTSLLFNMLSRLVIAFLPKSKRLNFMAAVTICSDFGAQEKKICQCCPQGTWKSIVCGGKASVTKQIVEIKSIDDWM